MWLAPTSDHRLDMPSLLIAKVVVFGLATAALAAAGHPRLASALGVLAAVNLALAVLLGNPDRAHASPRPGVHKLPADRSAGQQVRDPVLLVLRHAVSRTDAVLRGDHGLHPVSPLIPRGRRRPQIVARNPLNDDEPGITQLPVELGRGREVVALRFVVQPRCVPF